MFQTKSDIIRLALLKKYGGVWMDVSTLLLKSIDDWCYNSFDK
jgi:mannosyltransferase OCH1-like enzyme